MAKVYLLKFIIDPTRDVDVLEESHFMGSCSIPEVFEGECEPSPLFYLSGFLVLEKTLLHPTVL